MRKKVDEIKKEMSGDWLPAIYRDRIRSERTRAYSLDVAERENHPEIMHTLLGIELKVGRRRFACPDLATARYIRSFARIGSREFAIPYDITKISGLADELETSWHRMLLLSEGSGRLRSLLIKAVRIEIREIGPGLKMPEFRASTGQSGA